MHAGGAAGLRLGAGRHPESSAGWLHHFNENLSHLCALLLGKLLLLLSPGALRLERLLHSHDWRLCRQPGAHAATGKRKELRAAAGREQARGCMMRDSVSNACRQWAVGRVMTASGPRQLAGPVQACDCTCGMRQCVQHGRAVVVWCGGCCLLGWGENKRRCVGEADRQGRAQAGASCERQVGGGVLTDAWLH